MKRVGLFAAILLMMSLAQAGVLIEPFVGYGFMSGENDASLNGAFLGGRLGYEKLGFYGQFEYNKTDFSGDIKTGTQTEDVEVDGHTLGLILGYEFPALIRAYGGYTFDGDKEATGFILGLGYKLLPLVLADLYINGEFRTLNLEAFGVEADYKVFAITVSLPINL